jgi:hypothetical protein
VISTKSMMNNTNNRKMYINHLNKYLEEILLKSMNNKITYWEAIYLNTIWKIIILYKSTIHKLQGQADRIIKTIWYRKGNIHKEDKQLRCHLTNIENIGNSIKKIMYNFSYKFIIKWNIFKINCNIWRINWMKANIEWRNSNLNINWKWNNRKLTEYKNKMNT